MGAGIALFAMNVLAFVVLFFKQTPLKGFLWRCFFLGNAIFFGIALFSGMVHFVTIFSTIIHTMLFFHKGPVNDWGWRLMFSGMIAIYVTGIIMVA